MENRGFYSIITTTTILMFAILGLILMYYDVKRKIEPTPIPKIQKTDYPTPFIDGVGLPGKG